ncbi:sodium:proline symporter [Hahella sp. HN01]|uniref:sodium:solute symporter family transporter n=1 Tax=Hahella sp. HN01 TaxID=2847262 RepID=UPI001C1EDF0C|nr:sodium:proline symporter [Hahella sp. HN01]MBU6951066.1 sodium:proline symporter [Hahella sp. HN01]
MAATFLPAFVAIIAIFSIFLSPRAKSDGAFFKGLSPDGRQPSLITLIFSQVTTWIFARSLMNAAILGYYYGLWGALAYAAYYLSFLTGAAIIDSLRFRHGCESVQEFLRLRFGGAGASCYNLVIAIRLVSEVFANLLVIGILFGSDGSHAYVIAILGFSAITLLYSALGGLHASLRTDVFQMGVFLVVLAALVAVALTADDFSFATLLFKPFVIDDPGPILLAVALLQVWSYPMHDPVMMDRGFLADRQTTRKSFVHAAWISSLCITLFGCLGVFAGAQALQGEDMNAALTRLLGETPMLIFSAALVVSAMSTLDSTLASSAKLAALDMGLLRPTLANGRVAMALFMAAGLLCVFFGSKDLFAAVAVSGTASMYLTPVVFFSLWRDWRDVPLWSYLTSFCVAVGGAALYFTESSSYSNLIEPLFGVSHKYSKLLLISLVVMAVGCAAFWVGARFPFRSSRTPQPALE